MSASQTTDAPVKSTLITRLLHGAGAGVVSYLFGIASNLLLLPLYLRFWPVDVYGEWMALYSAVLYLGNLDFGITLAGVNAATMAYARRDWPELKRIQGTAWAASLTIAALGALLIAIPSLLFYPVERWLNLRALTPGEGRFVFFCLAMSVLVNIPGRQLIFAYISIGEFATYQWLYNLFAVLSCVAVAGSLIAGASPAQLAAVSAAITLLTAIIAAVLLRRRNPQLVPRIGAADWRTARTLAAPTGQFGLSLLATLLTIQGPVILLSRGLGGPAVALFTTTRTVANVIRGTVTLFQAPLRPEFAAVSAAGSKEALGRLFRMAVGIDAVVSLSLFAALWSGGSWLIRFWSHGQIDASPGFLHLILIAVLLEGFLLALSSAGWATNKARALSLAQFFTAISSLVLAAWMLGAYGVLAVPAGTLVPLLVIMMPVVISEARRQAGVHLPFVVGRLLLPFVAVGLFSVAIAQSWPGGVSWMSGAFTTLMTLVLAVLIVDKVFFTHEDRLFLRRKIRSRFFQSE